MGKFDDSSLIIETLSPDIVHVRAVDAKTLASAMVRFQEYYESPFPEIKGQIFTLGYLRSFGSRNRPGVYTYEGGKVMDTDWTGYNFPSYVLDPFIKGLFDPLTPHEQDIVNALRCKMGKFYIIGTYGDNESCAVLDHEICHALYYISDEYRAEVNEAMATLIGKSSLSGFMRMIKDMGYAEEVLMDEAHAYISADLQWIKQEKAEELKKYGVIIPQKLQDKLVDIKNKYVRHYKIEV